MTRRAAVALLVFAGCSPSSPTPFAPADAGEEAATTPDAGPPCKTVFEEEFRVGLGTFVAESSADGTVAVVDGYLRGSFSATPATTSFASATTTATFEATKTLRVFYTSRISKWARDTRALIGCKVAFPGGGPEIVLELTTKAGPTEDEMSVSLGGEPIDSLIGPDERHVVAIAVALDGAGTTGTVDLLWDGVSRKKITGATFTPPLDRVKLTCGVVGITTAPMTSAEGAFAGVDDISISACP